MKAMLNLVFKKKTLQKFRKILLNKFYRFQFDVTDNNLNTVYQIPRAAPSPFGAPPSPFGFLPSPAGAPGFSPCCILIA